MGCEVVLEEWGCASEIKQILNKIKATPCKPAEVFLVYSTLPKVVARRASTSRTGSRSTTGSVSHTGNYSNQDSALWSNFLEHQLWQSFKLCQSLRWKSDVLRLVRVFGRKRKFSKGDQEVFWWKKAVRRVGLAYRELIGSLYESWTIGIGRVYKKLINSIIQRCKKR